MAQFGDLARARLPAPLSPASRASFELVNAGIAMRRLRINAARYARAGKRHSRQTCIASLAAEVESEFLAMANDRLLCNSDIATHGSDSMAHSCSLRLRECAICLMGAGMPAS
jgi:hypothetical protein